MSRRSLLNLLYFISTIMILPGMSLPGCSGSTSIQRHHHLLLEDSASVCVSFIRLKEFASEPIEILLDVEKLLDLSEGKYTVLKIKPGKYGVVINNSKWEKVDTQYVTVNITRNFDVDLSKADSVYIVFNREKFDFWELVGKSFIDEIIPVIDTISIGEYFSIPTEAGTKTYPGYGYTGKSVTRKTAVKIASELEPVGTRKIR